jgi:excisionase family DNA binding protein
VIRMPPGAVILEPAEVEYLARPLESFAQLMAVRRDHNGNLAPSRPSPRLAAITDKFRRTVDSLAVRDSAADHRQQAESSAGSASVRAPERDSGHAGPHDIGTGDAARRLGITPNAVRDLARRGRVPVTHTGTRWRYDAAAVDALAEQRASQRRK